jgi:uroporphyrinogen decarboxylase
MLSRERFRLAINHKEPDRVPLDFGGPTATGIHIDEYCELSKYFKIDDAYPRKCLILGRGWQNRTC